MWHWQQQQYLWLSSQLHLLLTHITMPSPTASIPCRVG